MNIKVILVVVLIVCLGSIETTPVDSESTVEIITPEKQIEQENGQRGIFDGAIIPTTTTTTAAPLVGGLGGLGGLGTNIGNAGPMLIIGGFQAIVTKFDPSMIGSIPGMPALPNLGT